MIQDNTFHTSPTGHHSSPRPRFAPVVPLSIAAELQNSGTLGDYHLLLAHDVLMHPQEYAEIYGNKGYTILMDNSLIELGYAMPIGEVLDAANIVGGQYIILPDTLKQAETTINQVRGAMDDWRAIEPKRKQGVGLLPVIQGITLKEQLDCFLEFINLSKTHDIKGMCIPRVIADTCGSRKHLIDFVTRRYNIHLLGFSNNLMDDVACARMPGVIGIDSAEPIRLGLRTLTISLDTPQDAGERMCYWDNPYGLKQWHTNTGDGAFVRNAKELECFSHCERLEVINHNLTTFRQWISK